MRVALGVAALGVWLAVGVGLALAAMVVRTMIGRGDWVSVGLFGGVLLAAFVSGAWVAAWQMGRYDEGV